MEKNLQQLWHSAIKHALQSLTDHVEQLRFAQHSYLSSP